MAVPKGTRIGGRKKGTPNKRTAALEHRGDPLVKLSAQRIHEILSGTLKCSVCRGARKTEFRLKAGAHADGCPGSPCCCRGISTRPCASCNETGYEQLSPDIILKASLAVREEAYPKLKAVEHTGPGGGPLQAAITVRFIKAPTLIES